MALLKIRNENGEIVEIASLPGKKGDDGKTPVKGVDYFTVEEIGEIIAAAKLYTDEKTAPANSETYGTVKVADNKEMASITTGIYPDENSGNLRIVPASKYQIDGRFGDCAAIVPDNLEYAVKSVGDGYYAKAEELGDIETALDELHTYAQLLVSGGATE